MKSRQALLERRTGQGRGPSPISVVFSPALAICEAPAPCGGHWAVREGDQPLLLPGLTALRASGAVLCIPAAPQLAWGVLTGLEPGSPRVTANRSWLCSVLEPGSNSALVPNCPRRGPFSGCWPAPQQGCPRLTPGGCPRGQPGGTAHLESGSNREPVAPDRTVLAHVSWRVGTRS